MKETIFALFNDRERANEALHELSEEGYTESEVSVITREDRVPEVKEGTGHNVGQGAKTGGLLGGILGLLVGIGALAIPGIGALFIAGPIAAALGLTGVAATTASGAVTGALAGGLVGALKSLGVDEVQAKVIEDRVKEGDILLSIYPTEDDAENVKEILRKHGAEHISESKINV